jgi:hypothetical protein
VETARSSYGRVPLELNGRVGTGALCAPCPPLATDRLGTGRGVKLASRNDSARAPLPTYKGDPVSSGPAVADTKVRASSFGVILRSQPADENSLVNFPVVYNERLLAQPLVVTCVAVNWRTGASPQALSEAGYIEGAERRDRRRTPLDATRQGLKIRLCSCSVLYGVEHEPRERLALRTPAF